MTGGVPRYCTREQAERWAALELALDQYGETPRLPCPMCGESDAAKASIPINLWRCATCGALGPADKLAAGLEARAEAARSYAGVEPLA